MEQEFSYEMPVYDFLKVLNIDKYIKYMNRKGINPNTIYKDRDIYDCFLKNKERCLKARIKDVITQAESDTVEDFRILGYKYSVKMVRRIRVKFAK